MNIRREQCLMWSSSCGPGKSEQQKTRLAQAITKDVMDILHYGEESVSVAMEEVKSQDWVQTVLGILEGRTCSRTDLTVSPQGVLHFRTVGSCSSERRFRANLR